MKKVTKSPLVMDVLNIANVQRQLERLADLLNKIQKVIIRAIGLIYIQEIQMTMSWAHRYLLQFKCTYFARSMVTMSLWII